MRGVVIAGLLVLAAGVLLVDHVRSQPPGPREDGRSPRGDRREGGGPPGGGPNGVRPPPPPIIQALDLDGDGELSADEIKEASTNLLKLDKDKDGTLSREETRPPHPGGEGGPGGRGPRGPGGPGGPEGEERGPGRGPRGPGRGPDDGPRGDRGDQRGPGGPGGPGDDRGPPRHGKPPEIGHVLPPFVRDEISLTDDQKKQIEALESDVKDKLTKILTPEQKAQFEDLLQRGPGEPPHRGPGGPGGRGAGPGGRPEQGGDRPPRPRRPEGGGRPQSE
jgi:hypothetical protein